VTQNRHASSSHLMCTTFFLSKGARLTVQFNLFRPAPCSTALPSTSWTAPLVHPVANPSLNAPLLRSPTHFSPSLLRTGRRPDIVPPPAGHGGAAPRGCGGDGAGRRQAAQCHPAGSWRERRPGGGAPGDGHGHNSRTAGGHRRTGRQTAARPSLDGQTSAKLLAWSRQQGPSPGRRLSLCAHDEATAATCT
jgi:hypothetical protein